MKIKTLIACFILACAATSCIQDEALNSEAAIDACTGDDVQLANINADSKLINVYVNKGADLSKQKVRICNSGRSHYKNSNESSCWRYRSHI